MARRYKRGKDFAIVGNWQEKEFEADGWELVGEYNPDEPVAEEEAPVVEEEKVNEEVDEPEEKCIEDEIANSTVKELEVIADELNVDISGCKNKADKQQALLDSLEE